MPPFVWVKLKTARFAHVKSQKQQFVVASSGYLQRAGRPRQIEDWLRINCHYTNQGNGAVWKMTSQTGEKRQIGQRVVYGQ